MQNHVAWIGDRSFEVAPEKGTGVYQVVIGQSLAACKRTCMDYVTRGRPCKRIGGALLFVRKIKKEQSQSQALRRVSCASSSEELIPTSALTVKQAVLRAAALADPLNDPTLASRRNRSASCWEGLRFKAHFLQETQAATGTAKSQSAVKFETERLPSKKKKDNTVHDQ